LRLRIAKGSEKSGRNPAVGAIEAKNCGIGRERGVEKTYGTLAVRSELVHPVALAFLLFL